MPPSGLPTTTINSAIVRWIAPTPSDGRKVPAAPVVGSAARFIPRLLMELANEKHSVYFEPTPKWVIDRTVSMLTT
jgi:hypothetical protein